MNHPYVVLVVYMTFTPISIFRNNRYSERRKKHEEEEREG